MWLDHRAEKDFGMVHCFIESIKVTVSQVVVVHKVPLSTAMLITISVSFAREIDPFWVTKFISHEIEISFTAQRLRKKSDHLVQGHSTRDSICAVSKL